MKKWIALMMSLLLMLALASCGGNSGGDSGGGSSDSSSDSAGAGSGEVRAEDGYAEARIGDVVHSYFMDFSVNSAYTTSE